MDNKAKNWYTHPQKSTLLVLFVLWLTSITLLAIAATDSFNSSIDWDFVTLLSPIILGSTAFVYEMGLKYLKNRSEESSIQIKD